MSSIHDEARAQLASELGTRLYALSMLDTPEATMDVDRRAATMAARTIGPLCSPDDREAAQATIDVICALWPDGTEPPHEWWRTPLGRLCARSAGTDDAEAVTYSVAAAMLGVTRGTISQMTHRGTLDRHPDGGVLRSSIMQRLSRGT